MINVEDLKSSLLKMLRMKERFRMPLSSQDMHDELLAAIMADVECRHRDFVMPPELECQLWQFANWITSNSPKFGILLCGECGNGKSTFLRAFQRLLNYHQFPDPNMNGKTLGMRIINTRELVVACKSNPSEFLQIIKVPMLGIDDLGIEPAEVMDYGNLLTPIVDLLTKRYDDQLFTMITTNLTPKDIHEQYGARIADRLNEMVEKIIFRNGTYRKQ